MVTNNIGPSVKWKSLKIKEDLPSDSKINYSLSGITENGTVDSLGTIQITDSTASLANVDAKKYPYIKISSNLNASTDGTSPSLDYLSVDYDEPAELGLNYQTVSLVSDTVYQGDNVKMNYTVMNAGFSSADSFKVKVYLNKPDKSQRLLFDTLITSLKAKNRLPLQLAYKSNFNDGYGNMSFAISIDPDQKITEFYKDNNFYNQAFYIYKDTVTLVKTASLAVTFDGNNIYDGDYVSSNPVIEFKLNYGYQYPYRDTTKITFNLDGKTIYYSQLDSIVYDTIHQQVYFKVKPHLLSGEHSLSVSGEGLINQAGDLQKYFNVSDELKLMDVYNYPNPFSSQTFFTFNLTKIPDELKIKVYTIAGRLIKEINVPSSELRNNFNKIPWDGRDADGDIIANGVYLYRVIAKSSTKTASELQKLAIVR